MLNLSQVKDIFSANGALRVLLKRLAPNDNSKNQPYLAPDLSHLSFLPTGAIQATETNSTKPGKSSVKFLVDIDFSWLSDDGSIERAPYSKLIFYPQYPEVRFSGFLRGCRKAPRELMSPQKRGREEGRLLLFGVCADGRIIGYLCDWSSPVASELSGVADLSVVGVFEEIPIGLGSVQGGSRLDLLSNLCRIHKKSWIDSKRLDKYGAEIAYTALNGGGFTLEAEFGIIPNGISEPDYMGWEIKQFGVKDFGGSFGGRVTLMTPEPSAGFYQDEGVEAFLSRFGYEDLKGRDRVNFCGQHRYEATHQRTGLRLALPGFDTSSNRITDPMQGLTLFDKEGKPAAIWSYSKLIEHWKKKHAKAVYVPSQKRVAEPPQYRYSKSVMLGEETGIIQLLSAIASGAVVYDPGIVMYDSLGSRRPIKKRSQFRTTIKKLPALYKSFKRVDACNEVKA